MSELQLRPGLADVPVAESGISFIDGQRARLEYRGIAVETLARESCYEETAYLLLKGELPSQRELADFDDQLRHRRRLKYKLKDLIKCLPETGHPMDALQASVAAMGMFYPARDVTNQESNWDSTVRLIAKLPTAVAAFHRLRYGDEAIDPRDDLDHASNFYYMLFEKTPTPAVRKIIDACLILHAEHTMNASTFSGRVTGSTLANPYTVVSSAIGTLTGPLHAGPRPRPRRRVAAALAGAIAEQPHLPARADLRRQARRALRAAGKAAVAKGWQARQGPPGKYRGGVGTGPPSLKGGLHPCG